MNTFLSKLHEQRNQKTEIIDSTLNRAATEDRDITDIELANIQALKLEIEKLDERIAQVTDLEVRKAAAAELAATLPEGTETRAAAPARVTREEPTYHERSGHDFMADAIAAEFGGSYEARERIARYQNEVRLEKRDSGTSNFAGLVVPQYLVDQFAPLRRAGRKTLDISTSMALPANGMTVNIGRLTTGVTSYAQATQNTAPTESSPDDTLLTINVNTVASMFDVSKQAILRGTGVETQLLGDAIRSYQSEVDRQAINGLSASGEHVGILNTSGINAVTYTDASPTYLEAWPKLIDAIQNVASNYYGGATHWVMHPTMAGALLKAVDGSNRPMFTPASGGPMNAPGSYDAPGYDSRFSLLGLPVIEDANVPTNLGAGTNETAIIVGDFSQSYIWEDNGGNPLYVRFEQPDGNIAIRTVVFGFSAYTAGKYPKAFTAITGTGLITANW